MRKLTLMIFAAVLLAACAGGPPAHPAFKSTSRDKLKLGSWIEGDTVVFAFDPAVMGLALKAEQLDPATLSNVRVAGSFTFWKQKSAWNMRRLPGSPAWILKKPLKEVLIPGNSGRPEFAFCVTKSGSTDVYWLKPKEDVPLTGKVSDQHTGHFNFVVMLPGDRPEELKRINKLIFSPARKPFKDERRTANFRVVTIGRLAKNRLYRSYHPFTVSKKGEFEKFRVKMAATMLETHGINAVINLTDDTTLKKQKGIPVYYRNLLDSGRVLMAQTEYRTVYFKSRTKKFEKLIGRVSRFIISKKAPFMIHCRLGTDRTGVVTAILAGLAGATWKEIKTDYEKTNDNRIGEYRSGTLLRYSLEQLLGFRITDRMRLDTALIKWLQGKGILGKTEIRDLLRKLTK